MTDVGLAAEGALFKVQRAGHELAAELRGRGRRLIWAHGLMASKEMTFQMLDGLPEFAVLAFDQLGHAASSPLSDQSSFTVEQLAEDLGAVMSAAGWPRAVVGGDSIGAIVAAHFARINPSRVDALILDIPAIGRQPNASLASTANAALLRASGLSGYIAARVEAADAGLREDLEKRLRPMRAHDNLSVAAAFEAVGNWRYDLDGLRQIRVPVAIRAWRGDAVHPFELAEELARIFGDVRVYEESAILNVDMSANAESLRTIASELTDRVEAAN